MFVSPSQIINSLAIGNRDVVADFGCGNGAYVFAISRLVGDTGKVYAVDIHTNILDKINREADKMNIINIDTISSDIEERVQIDSYSCDIVIISNVLSEVDNSENVVKEAKRILKPGGIVLIVDWKNTEHVLSAKRHRTLKVEEIETLLDKYNLHIKRHLPAGDYHFAFSAME